MSSYTPAIITASVALIAAILAQVLSHYLNIRRENINAAKSNYQELIAPILLEVFAYIDIETNYRKGHDVEGEVDKDKLISHIENNIKYGSSNLINALEETKKHQYYFDGRGLDADIQHYYLFFFFLDDLLELHRKSKNKILNKNLKERVIYYQLMYGLWFSIANSLASVEDATLVIKHKWTFKNEKIKKRHLKELKESFNKNWNSKMTALIIKDLLREDSLVSEFEHVISSLEND